MKLGLAASIVFVVCQFMELFLLTTWYFVYRLAGVVSKKTNFKNREFSEAAMGKEGKSRIQLF